MDAFLKEIKWASSHQVQPAPQEGIDPRLNADTTIAPAASNEEDFVLGIFGVLLGRIPGF